LTNGATVSDWLGAAAVNARVAASRIEALRGDVPYGLQRGNSDSTLALIIEELESALLDVRTVLGHLANFRALKDQERAS
jgi:hypothetical protein